MLEFNIEELLKRKNKTKYWLCQKMGITYTNLNKVIYGETTLISFKYLEDFCKYLECTPSGLITVKLEDLN